MAEWGANTVQDFFRQLLDQLHDGVYCLDTDRQITFWSKGAERITGYPASEVVGRSCADNILMHVDKRGKQICLSGNCPANKVIQGSGTQEVDVFLHHKNGHRVPVSVRTSKLEDDEGKVIGAVEIFSERYDKLAMEEQLAELQKLSLLDALTKVGNRRFGEEELRSHMNAFERNGVPFGALLLDLDHFKAINDTHGHDTGDRVLKMVAGTLAANVRSFDHVSRWGGEEFLVILANVDLPRLRTIADKLRSLVRASRLTDHTPPVRVTVSIGAALVTGGDSVRGLVNRADQLLYQSKSAGRNRVTCQQPAGSSDPVPQQDPEDAFHHFDGVIVSPV